MLQVYACGPRCVPRRKSCLFIECSFSVPKKAFRPNRRSLTNEQRLVLRRYADEASDEDPGMMLCIVSRCRETPEGFPALDLRKQWRV